MMWQMSRLACRVQTAYGGQSCTDKGRWTGIGGKEGHLNVPGCNSAYPRVQKRCQDSKRIFGSGTLVRDQAEDEQVRVCMFGICES